VADGPVADPGREAGGGRRLPLVLASSSPQRRAILSRLGVEFTVRAVRTREREVGDPALLAQENAMRKARAAYLPGAREAVLACDTVVALEGVIYGKPADERGARETLRALSATTHEVVGGLALLLAGEESGPRPSGTPATPGGRLAPRSTSAGDARPIVRTALARTRVSFRGLSDELLAWYLATGEWRGRAGGYAIQGAGAALVRAVVGDYENVVGLPLATLLDVYPELLMG
jgi:septum formation protein